MSNSVKTLESEELFGNVKGKSESVELDDINENNDGDENASGKFALEQNGKKEVLENVLILDILLDDEVEKLKQYRESCRK